MKEPKKNWVPSLKMVFPKAHEMEERWEMLSAELDLMASSDHLEAAQKAG